MTINGNDPGHGDPVPNEGAPPQLAPGNGMRNGTAILIAAAVVVAAGLIVWAVPSTRDAGVTASPTPSAVARPTADPTPSADRAGGEEDHWVTFTPDGGNDFTVDLPSTPLKQTKTVAAPDGGSYETTMYLQGGVTRVLGVAVTSLGQDLPANEVDERLKNSISGMAANMGDSAQVENGTVESTTIVDLDGSRAMAGTIHATVNSAPITAYVTVSFHSGKLFQLFSIGDTREHFDRLVASFAFVN